MNAFGRALQRLRGQDVREPPSPVPARDLFRSIVFSAEDDIGPSPQLLDLATQTVQAAMERISLADVASRPGIPHWYELWPGQHYRLLAALIDVIKPKTVIEIGTFSGLSALSMKKYLPPDGRLATFDIVPWKQIDETVLCDADFADGRLTQQSGNLAEMAFVERHRALLESADFLFIDGPKDGVTEYRFIENFQRLRFARPPLLWFDDTKLWSMLRFWRVLADPKLDMTSFGNWSGTGWVQWR